MIKQTLPQALLSVLLLTLMACTPDVPSGPDPSASPSPDSSAAPDSSTPDNVAQVNVQILIQDDNNQRIQNATVTLHSDTAPPQTLSTDSSGTVIFQNLRQESTYSIDVSATGYSNASRSANLSQLATQNDQELLLGIVLKRLNTYVSGRVVDNSGQPVVNATVFDTQQSQLTNENGEFVLSHDQAESFRLSISKTGYETLAQNVILDLNEKKELGTLTMTPISRPLNIVLDLSHAPLGQSSLNAFQGLTTTLSQEGHNLQMVSSNLVDQLSNCDVLIELSPSQDFGIEESSAIQAFVLSGHKLIVTGEWAGFGGYSSVAANQLLEPFGLQFGADTLRENGSGFLSSSNIESSPVTRGINQLYFYQSASVLISKAENERQILVRTGSDAFRITDNSGSFGLLGVSPFGSGKVIAVGDTSLWSDDDSDQNGVSDLDEGQNRQLLQQLIHW